MNTTGSGRSAVESSLATIVVLATARVCLLEVLGL